MSLFGGEKAETLMPHDFRSRYREQLPRPSRWSWLTVFYLIGSFCSVISLVGFFIALDQISDDAKVMVFATYLFAIVVFLVTYILITEKKKLHRYAQSVFYVHFVNHAIRDCLAHFHNEGHVQLDMYLNEIMAEIASCFSLLVGKRCRCSIKDVSKDLTIFTRARDPISAHQSSDTSRDTHCLSDNTDFNWLWYGQEGCVRYFFCNDLINRWRADKYFNSSFASYGQPKSKSIGKFKLVTWWPLPYKSTMVFPIRHIPNHRLWPPRTSASDNTPHPAHFLGFLCIDSRSKNVFDKIHGPDLGAAFADALYILFTQLDYMSREHAGCRS